LIAYINQVSDTGSGDPLVHWLPILIRWVIQVQVILWFIDCLY